MATSTRITADEFLAHLNEDEFAELIDGERVVSSPSIRHQQVVMTIGVELTLWIRAGGRGAVLLGVGARLSDYDLFIPDVSWVAELPDRDGVLHGPPGLAVEVRSPSTWRYDIGIKKRTYERAGLRELWLVDPPASTVRILRRSQPDAPEFDVSLELTTGDRLATPLLPGFALDLGELFT
jgi:Uma2 family endonuclease